MMKAIILLIIGFLCIFDKTLSALANQDERQLTNERAFYRDSEKKNYKTKKDLDKQESTKEAKKGKKTKRSKATASGKKSNVEENKKTARDNEGKDSTIVGSKKKKSKDSNEENDTGKLQVPYVPGGKKKDSRENGALDVPSRPILRGKDDSSADSKVVGVFDHDIAANGIYNHRHHLNQRLYEKNNEDIQGNRQNVADWMYSYRYDHNGKEDEADVKHVLAPPPLLESSEETTKPKNNAHKKAKPTKASLEGKKGDR